MCVLNLTYEIGEGYHECHCIKLQNNASTFFIFYNYFMQDYTSIHDFFKILCGCDTLVGRQTRLQQVLSIPKACFTSILVVSCTNWYRICLSPANWKRNM